MNKRRDYECASRQQTTENNGMLNIQLSIVADQGYLASLSVLLNGSFTREVTGGNFDWHLLKYQNNIAQKVRMLILRHIRISICEQ